jgi:hypothetical protein
VGPGSRTLANPEHRAHTHTKKKIINMGH